MELTRYRCRRCDRLCTVVTDTEDRKPTLCPYGVESCRWEEESYEETE